MSLTSRPPQSASRERAGVDSLYRGSARLGAISCLNTHETNHVFGGRPYQLEAASSTGSSVGALFHGTRSVGLHSPSDYEWPPDRSNHIRTSGRKKGIRYYYFWVSRYAEHIYQTSTGIRFCYWPKLSFEFQRMIFFVVAEPRS